MENIKEKNRLTNFEILRIISMIMIILHHYSVHGGILEITSYGINKYIAVFCYSLGKIGVNIFFLISGYFLINSKFKISKVIKLIMQVLEYSIPLTIVFMCFNKEIAIKKLLKSIIIIFYNHYWFINTYIIIYLLMPFFNKFIKIIKKEQFLIIIFILVSILVILPNLKLNSAFYGQLQWGIFMYFIGAYIKLYAYEERKKHIKIIKTLQDLNFIICIIFLVYIFVLFLFTYYSSFKDNEVFKKIDKLIDMNSIFPFILSILIFIKFSKIKMKNNKVINFFGGTSFGVYLFHDCIYKKTIWNNILCTQKLYYANPILLVLHIIISTIFIYLLGSIYEIGRRKIFENKKIFLPRVKKWCEEIDIKFNN